MTNKPETLKYRLIMDDDTAAKADRLRILEEDICNVIDYAETTGRRTRIPDSGRFRAYNEIGAITLWVEYEEISEQEDVQGSDKRPMRQIHNIYSHRMQIKLEAVFNGRKTDEQLRERKRRKTHM